MNILVCGGAGYIGSHMVHLLLENSHDVVVFDNLSTGHRDAVRSGTLVVGDITNELALDRLFIYHGPFDAVMHFCAKSLVGESVVAPAAYYVNNVIGTINLLEAMRQNNVPRFVFSSTAAVYGEPIYSPIDEAHPCDPLSPYGVTKLVVEYMLKNYCAAYDMSSVSFRYFNAAGALSEHNLGERHEPESHLIPNVLSSILADDKCLTVFGDDYDTDDGTCVRDYVHVADICHAHMAALNYMDKAPGAHVMNLGNGRGYSVFDIIQTAQRVTGSAIDYKVSSRRVGDPPILVADYTKARLALGWQPKYPKLSDIIESAWQFHSTAMTSAHEY